MLHIVVPSVEQWDEAKNEFVYVKGQTLQLEHSLLSISKWESRWHKPFYSKQEKTYLETIDYIKCMTINPKVRDEVYNNLTAENSNQINEYISNSMTATTFNKETNKPSREQVTSELIYYWMVSLRIPLECEKWHINRLLTLIQICNVKNTPPKKRSRKEIASRNAALNAARRKQLNTRG